MADTVRDWDPNEWQDWVKQLLYAHYGHKHYQPVPDTDGGDYGIEGFSQDGCAYQCYAAEEPVGTEELYEKQRNKINEDLKKFVHNQQPLAKLFGALKIERWVFVVPRYE